MRSIAKTDFDPIEYINTPRWQQVKPGLERIAELLEGLGRPQDELRFVHVAGTNGKGSVCSYLANVLQAAGLRTGLFTSPYIERFEERIRIDGKDISPDELREATLEVRAVAEQMAEHPTEFELMCAVGLLHFARQACDIVVLEVGLGGRWDATNVIDTPEVCVICRLGLDHTGLLGETLGEIAAEKAGIIKNDCLVISWPQEPKAMEVIEHTCVEQRASLVVADFSQLRIEPLLLATSGATLPCRNFSYREHPFHTQLLGSYQPFNAALALETIGALRSRGWNIPDTAINAGIATTQWAARFEVCGTQPLFIVDGGHNPQGASVMADTLRELLPLVQPVFLIGILADKDYPAMLQEVVPLGSAFVCVTPNNPRALEASALAAEIRALVPANIPVESANSFEDAVVRARELAGTSGAVCAFGSLYSVGSIKQALAKTQANEYHCHSKESN